MNATTILTGSDRMNSVLWRSDGDAVHYSPYGSADNDAPGDIGFNSERRDPVSGHTHLGNGYRSYSPALMRFTCPDSMSPFGAAGINPYAYCSGDPVNRADPSGHMSTGQGVGLGLGLLAGILLSVFTGGASLAVALSAEVAGGTVIGAGSELIAEGIDHQKVNWGAVGIAAGMGAAMSLVGFGVGRAAEKCNSRVGEFVKDWRFRLQNAGGVPRLSTLAARALPDTEAIQGIVGRMHNIPAELREATMWKRQFVEEAMRGQDLTGRINRLLTLYKYRERFGLSYTLDRFYEQYAPKSLYTSGAGDYFRGVMRKINLREINREVYPEGLELMKDTDGIPYLQLNFRYNARDEPVDFQRFDVSRWHFRELQTMYERFSGLINEDSTWL